MSDTAAARAALRGRHKLSLRYRRGDAQQSEEAHPTQERFAIPASFSIDYFLPGGRAFQTERAEALRERYSPRVARWIAEREGVPLEPDGSLSLTHPLADSAWAVRHVLQYGPEAEVLDPAEVRATVRSRLQETARSQI